MTTENKDTTNTEPVPAKDDAFELPAWSAECSRDAVLQAWATMQLARQVAYLNDLIEETDVNLRLQFQDIERSLDSIANALPNAGKGD